MSDPRNRMTPPEAPSAAQSDRLRRFVVVCEDGTEFTDYDSQRQAEVVAAKIDAGGQMFPFHRMHCPGWHTVKDRLGVNGA